MQQHAVAERRLGAERGLWQDRLARDQPGDKLGQGEISDILTQEIARKDGLKEILKHLIRTKITEANNEINENSAFKNILKNSQIPSKESEDKSGSFLDKLSALYVPTTETPEHRDVFEEIENEDD